jgi:hypothetical protein
MVAHRLTSAAPTVLAPMKPPVRARASPARSRRLLFNLFAAISRRRDARSGPPIRGRISRQPIAGVNQPRASVWLLN